MLIFHSYVKSPESKLFPKGNNKSKRTEDLESLGWNPVKSQNIPGMQGVIDSRIDELLYNMDRSYCMYIYIYKYTINLWIATNYIWYYIYGFIPINYMVLLMIWYECSTMVHYVLSSAPGGLTSAATVLEKRKQAKGAACFFSSPHWDSTKQHRDHWGPYNHRPIISMAISGT